MQQYFTRDIIINMNKTADNCDGRYNAITGISDRSVRIDHDKLDLDLESESLEDFKSQYKDLIMQMKDNRILCNRIFISK